MAFFSSAPATTVIPNGGSSQLTDSESSRGIFTGPLNPPVVAGQKVETQILFDRKNSELISVDKDKFADINRKVADAWISVSLGLLSSEDPSWLHVSIGKAERYLMALYNDDEYRNFISSYLLILRNNSEVITQNPPAKKTLNDSLVRYKNSSRDTQDRMRFMRSLRVVGISPVGR